jgi:signal transduction histidine kinase
MLVNLRLCSAAFHVEGVQHSRFLCLYIAGIGESLIKAIFGCLLFSFVFTFVSLSAQKGDDAERAEIVKRRLVSGLAHDIKSPLSVVKGFAEMIG